MKKLVAMMLAVTMLLAVTACGAKEKPAPAEENKGAQTQEETPKTDDVVKLNFATNQPATHVVGPAYQALVDELNEKGEGRIEAKAFFSETMGSEKETVDMVANNINDVLCAPGPSAMSPYFATLELFDSPYMFRSPQHALNFANGEASEEMWDEFAKESGIRVLGTYYFGTRHLTCNGLNVQTPEDLKGFKLRVIDAPISLATGRALGAKPTPLPYGELYMGMQQKVVDGQENPLSNILAMKFYEVQDTLVLTGHVTAMVCFAISEEKWEAIPEDLQEVIQTAVDHAVEAASNAILDSEANQLKELEGYGMKIEEPDVEAFRASSASVIEEFSSNWMDGIYETVQSVEG